MASSVWANHDPMIPSAVPDAEEAPGTVHIVVYKVAGGSVEVRLDSYGMVSDLKMRIAEILKVPPACQKMIVGGLILNDADLVSTYYHTSNPVLVVTLIITLDEVTKSLEHFDHERREKALLVLADLGLQGGLSSMTAVIGHLQDIHSSIRRAALHALPKVVPKGNVSAIQALKPLLLDPVVCVRCKALETYAKLALTVPGDALVPEELRTCLHDNEFVVRSAALETLGRLASKGHSESLQLATECLRDTHASVRRAAVKVLTAVAERGDEQTIETVISLIERSSSGLKCAAMEALAAIAEKGDERAVLLICGFLQDQQGLVRLTAAKVLTKIAAAGDARVLSLQTAGLQQTLTIADAVSRRIELEQRYYRTMSKISEGVSDQTINWNG